MIPHRLMSGEFASQFQYGGRYLSVLTAMFLHGGWLHLIGNMLYLWIFGDNVEDRMGRVRFFVFYILCGVAASVGQALASPHSNVPTIGASGAIAGVLGAYFALFPRARVLTLIPIGIFIRVMELPAFFFLGFWFLLQFLYGSMMRGEGGVAWWAHVGGFVAGFVFVQIFKKR
jgi:membrane associated rhomboid family serine protease